MFKNPSTTFLAFLQATGLTIYVVLISFFFNFIIPRFGKGTEEFYAPIIMLLLFIMSAVISASLVLGKAAVLFYDKKYKQAFSLLGQTVAWVFFYFVAFITIFNLG